jgi:hypothetical protein
MNTKILTLAAVTALSLSVGASMVNAAQVSAAQTSTTQFGTPMAQPAPNHLPRFAPLQGGDGGAG